VTGWLIVFNVGYKLDMHKMPKIAVIPIATLSSVWYDMMGLGIKKLSAMYNPVDTPMVSLTVRTSDA